MPHLLNVWTSVASRLSDAPVVLLLLDYDGTLAPIAPRPELAVLPAAARRVLADLSGHPRFRPGIISGRGLSDLRERVGVPGIIYAGNHGLEIIGAGENFVHPQAASFRSALERVGSELRSRLAGYPGVLVEDKGLTLSVHYRQTDAALVPPVEWTFDDVVSAAPADLKVTRGKMVLEVRPDMAWNKGSAIAKLMEGYIKGNTEGHDAGNGVSPLPVFFGDDLTDEDGFEVVQAVNGIAVFVGPARQPTKAAYRVDSPAEVSAALQLMLGL